LEDRAADEGVQQLDEEDKVAGCEGVQQVEVVEEL